MTPEQYKKAKDLFGRVLECPPEERKALLSDCSDDSMVRNEVEALLREHDRPEKYLDSVQIPTGLAEQLADLSRETQIGAVTGSESVTPRTRTRKCVRCQANFDVSQKFCPKDGEVLIDDPMSLVGETLDGIYHIEALLGQGGMGTVYRARHVLLRDVVAIKTLPLEMGDNPAWLRRFQREGQAARRFRHPNAVAVYDLRSTAGGTTFMVLEYVDGRTLRSELKTRGPHSPDDVLSILAPIADVLDAAHARGVVHRDLKPDNVMLGQDTDGRTVVKVLDLGIAKLRDIAGAPPQSTELTQEGSVIGTPHYMSPEQWGHPSRDGNPEIDGRTDIYSVGVMAYEMLTGTRPITGDTTADVRERHISFDPPRVHELGVAVPPEFSQAIARAMAKDRVDRPSRAGEFIEELRAALARSQATMMKVAVKTMDRTRLYPSATESQSSATESPRTVQVAQPTRSTLPRAIGTLVVLLVAMALAYGAYWKFGGQPNRAATSEAAPVKPPEPSVVEALRYSLEVDPAHAIGAAPEIGLIPGGGQFKFHFTAREAGFLYIIAPGKGDVSMTFLTDVPLPESGVSTNRLEAGRNYSFPLGKDNWLGVADIGKPTVYTIIFSRAALRDPGALAEVAGKQLENTEQERVQILKSQSATAGKVSLSPDIREPGTSVVAADLAALSQSPLVFEISIRHR